MTDAFGEKQHAELVSTVLNHPIKNLNFVYSQQHKGL